MTGEIAGPRHEVDIGCGAFPEALRNIPRPPAKLYVIGNLDALVPGLAIIGARKATPYGLSCARRFARLAAEKGVVIVSGGARGCDSEAHWAAVREACPTVAFLGGGCDVVYPPEHVQLFQRIVDCGGAIVSERDWATPPLPFMFRERNRLIAGLADAVLIVEAGLPSGTFSTADEALEAGKEVLVVPGAITSETSYGSNKLLFQGASPIVDDESFEDALFRSCGALKRPSGSSRGLSRESEIVRAVMAEPLDGEALLAMATALYGTGEANAKLMEVLVEAEARGSIARQPDGRWGPIVR